MSQGFDTQLNKDEIALIENNELYFIKKEIRRRKSFKQLFSEIRRKNEGA
jgi:hypothetical protein